MSFKTLIVDDAILIFLRRASKTIQQYRIYYQLMNAALHHFDVELRVEWVFSLKMKPRIGQYSDAPKYGIHQTPNRYYHTAWHEYAVWRMARLESWWRAQQAAIPPRVGARSLRSGDTRMGLPIMPFRSHDAPYWSRDPPNGSILLGGGKETKRDSLSSSERKGNSPNRIPIGNYWEM